MRAIFGSRQCVGGKANFIFSLFIDEFKNGMVALMPISGLCIDCCRAASAQFGGEELQIVLEQLLRLVSTFEHGNTELEVRRGCIARHIVAVASEDTEQPGRPP